MDDANFFNLESKILDLHRLLTDFSKSDRAEITNPKFNKFMANRLESPETVPNESRKRTISNYHTSIGSRNEVDVNFTKSSNSATLNETTSSAEIHELFKQQKV